MSTQQWPCPAWCSDPHDPADPLTHGSRAGAVSVVQGAEVRHVDGRTVIAYERPHAVLFLDERDTYGPGELRGLAADLLAAADTLDQALRQEDR